MYGGASKYGRGGGRGGGGSKRLHSPFPPSAPLHRPSAPSGGASRLSLGGSRGARARPGSVTASKPAPSIEETFSLVSGSDPLAFAMVIRLTPDMVEEIRRVEAQGGNARIKFDGNANNPSGNVIDVGGKEFRFTWYGDSCDIYEERQSGEDGSGLLIESGCSWRKLTVQRILDESTKNIVKMRSEEAERKHKSRKAIVLDSHMKSQLPAVEAPPWKMQHKTRKEPPYKKRKVEPSQAAVVGAPKSSFKSGSSSKNTVKGRYSTSPLQSPRERYAPPVSPSGLATTNKSNANGKDISPNKMMSRGNVAISEKEVPNRSADTSQEAAECRGNFVNKSMDLQTMLISLLIESPKGLSLKALEKAVGEKIPSSAKKIEPIIKKIAVFQAPGRYILKQGVDFEGLKKLSSENGSSPEDNRRQTHAHKENRDEPALGPSSASKVPTDEREMQMQLDSKHEEELVDIENIDIEKHSSDPFSRKEDSNVSEGQQGSSSDSGSDSDSDSDSSESGSDSGSHSRSRSKSPPDSESGSSSGSDSDASNNSKEGSEVDVDVDIMPSDDDKKPRFYTSPATSKSDEQPVENGIDEKGDGHEVAVEIEKDFLEGDQAVELAPTKSVASNNNSDQHEETKPFSSGDDKHQEHQEHMGRFFNDEKNADEDSFRNEFSDNSERTCTVKSKKGSDLKRSDNKFERIKRLKEESLAQPQISGSRDVNFFRSPRGSTPDKHVDDLVEGTDAELIHRPVRDGNVDYGLQKEYSEEVPGKSSSEYLQTVRRPFNQSSGEKVAKIPEKHDNYAECIGHGHRSSDKGFYAREGFPVKKNKSHRDAQRDEGYGNEKSIPRYNKETGAGGRNIMPLYSHDQKQGEVVGNLKETGRIHNSDIGSSPRENYGNGSENSPIVGGRGGMLQRESSDLELGEFREPLPDDAPVKRQYERKSSFKQLEKNPTTSDFSKGKFVGNVSSDLGKPCSPSKNAAIVRSIESSNKWRTPECQTEDVSRSNHKVVQTQLQQPPRSDHAEFGSLNKKKKDAGGKSRENEDGVSKKMGPEGYGKSHKKAHLSASQQHNPRHGPLFDSAKEYRRQTVNCTPEVTNNRKETVSEEANNSVQKRRDSSSDESSSYSKYEKDEPELKGPIRDYDQYQEYVQEYRDKYDGYCSINKILEGYRNEFGKMGKDLNLAKERGDTRRYEEIAEQLRESYRQHGMRHKRLKKIFMILHEELKSVKQRIKDFAEEYTRD